MYRIEEFAFGGCENLSSITIPRKKVVETLDNYKTQFVVHIPSDVIEINFGAFEGCPAFETE